MPAETIETVELDLRAIPLDEDTDGFDYVRFPQLYSLSFADRSAPDCEEGTEVRPCGFTVYKTSNLEGGYPDEI